MRGPVYFILFIHFDDEYKHRQDLAEVDGPFLFDSMEKVDQFYCTYIKNLLSEIEDYTPFDAYVDEDNELLKDDLETMRSIFHILCKQAEFIPNLYSCKIGELEIDETIKKQKIYKKIK